MIFNRSEDSEYHTQLNNKYIPLQSCNSTSMIMALKQAGYNFDHIIDQPEDLLTTLIFSMDDDKIKELAPWAWDDRKDEPRIPPNEIHAVLEWATNHMMMGREVDHFTTNPSICTLIATILTGGGVVLSGVFPYKNKTIGHMVSLAGIVTNRDDNNAELENITHFIIDDPHGNFRTDYKDVRGNNIKITKEEFYSIFRDTDNRERKWAHIIKNKIIGPQQADPEHKYAW
ncbi:MAG: hypothetical protein JEY99_15160 [Spirochaetales bacterium]|nr:hypothetical protein [Spirochaetales bacterium]